MKYNVFRSPPELKDKRTITHLRETLMEIMRYTDDKELRTFIKGRLVETLDPTDEIDTFHIKRIFK